MSLKARRADREGIFSGNKPERAIIDIGSNTVRLVVYGGSLRAPVTLYNEKVAARLGKEINQTGRMPEDSIEMAMRGLRRFALLLDELGIADVETVATAAVREALNGPDFIAGVKAIGFEPRILTGEEEARISAHGVLGAFPGAQGIVADLGGGSLELVKIGDGTTAQASSLPLGTLRLASYGNGEPAAMREALKGVLDEAGWGDASDEPLYLVGGTWRAMAVYAMEASSYPLSDPHGYEMSCDDALALADDLATADPDKLSQFDRISTMRSATIPHAAVLLRAMLESLQPKKLVFSSWGLREGLLYDRLIPHAQQQDPLIAGVTLFAAQRGAPPMLATRVAGWTVEGVPSSGAGSERLRLAATMLALASMQVEPNLRLHQGIDWAVHKRWIALDAQGRAMLAAAIAANGNHCDLPEFLTELATDELLDEAICWGLAVRLARRIGARSRRSFQISRLVREEDKLVLMLHESHGELFGIPTEKDMALLADRLGLEPDVRIVADADWGAFDDSDERLAAE